MADDDFSDIDDPVLRAALVCALHKFRVEREAVASMREYLATMEARLEAFDLPKDSERPPSVYIRSKGPTTAEWMNLRANAPPPPPDAPLHPRALPISSVTHNSEFLPPGLRILWKRVFPVEHTWGISNEDTRNSFLTSAAQWTARAKKTPNVGLRLTGGWEHLLTNILSVTCTLHASPLDSPTPVFTGRTEFCTSMGACQGPITPEWKPPDHMNSLLNNVFIRTDMLRIVPRLLLDKIFTCDGKAVILHRRESSSLWSAHLEREMTKGRGHILAHWETLPFRSYPSEGGHHTWCNVEGAWEFWLLENGLQPLGSTTPKLPLEYALKNLTRKSKNAGWEPPPAHTSPADKVNLNEIVQQWWVQWHEESILRTRLTAVGTIDWDKVHASLKRSNLLLYTTPDRRLQRVARLTKVGLDVDLDKVGRWIYALVGAKPTYVGQTGCVIEPRAPLTRLKDHFAKAKALRRTWKAKRSMVRVEGWGVTPPLPRIMATFGMGYFHWF